MVCNLKLDIRNVVRGSTTKLIPFGIWITPPDTLWKIPWAACIHEMCVLSEKTDAYLHGLGAQSCGSHQPGCQHGQPVSSLPRPHPEGPSPFSPAQALLASPRAPRGPQLSVGLITALSPKPQRTQRWFLCLPPC